MVDSLLLAELGNPAVALNIGGIANITVVRPGESPIAYDTGPGNALIDAAVAHFSGGAAERDTDGTWARSGKVDRALLEFLLDDAFLRQPPPKSTGKELYNLAYLLRAEQEIGVPEPADVVATATELTIRTIATACKTYAPHDVLVSGGGLYNTFLMERLTEVLLPARVRPIDVLGIPAKAKEAIAFAVLGFLTFCGLPGTIESCTGARRATILGSVTPGAAPLQLPWPTPRPPGRLSVKG
jgi:anhydro-N-acetylmuramic acid kinase